MFPTKRFNAFLESLGFTGSLPTKFRKFLDSAGQTAALNQALYKYLGGLGYSGALPERMRKWIDSDFATPVAGPVFEIDVFEAGVFE